MVATAAIGTHSTGMHSGLTYLFPRLNLVHELTRWSYQACTVETIVLMLPFIQFYVCSIKHPIDMDTQSRSCDGFSYPNGSRIPAVVMA